MTDFTTPLSSSHPKKDESLVRSKLLESKKSLPFPASKTDLQNEDKFKKSHQKAGSPNSTFSSRKKQANPANLDLKKEEKTFEQKEKQRQDFKQKRNEAMQQYSLADIKKEMELLEARLIQSRYLNLKMECSIKQQEIDASRQFEAVWKDVERLEQECHMLQQKIDEREFAECLKKQLEINEKHLFPLRESISSFLSNYDKMAEDIYSVAHRLPIKNAIVDIPSFESSVQKAEKSFSELEESLEEIKDVMVLLIFHSSR